MPYSSTCTEWSMTRSTGWSGLMRCGSPPSAAMRVAHGGEVDDGGHAGEVLQQHAARCGTRSPFRPSPFTSHFAIASMSARFTNAPSSFRSRFSRRILRLKGSLSAVAARGLTRARRGGRSCTACPRRSSVARLPKEFVLVMGVVSRCRPQSLGRCDGDRTEPLAGLAASRQADPAI